MSKKLTDEEFEKLKFKDMQEHENRLSKSSIDTKELVFRLSIGACVVVGVVWLGTGWFKAMYNSRATIAYEMVLREDSVDKRFEEKCIKPYENLDRLESALHYEYKGYHVADIDRFILNYPDDNRFKQVKTLKQDREVSCEVALDIVKNAPKLDTDKIRRNLVIKNIFGG